MPAQPVDATPSNALIRQCFPGRSDLFGCPRSKPSQGSVPADLTLASDLAFVFNASRVRLECCVDPLRPARLPDELAYIGLFFIESRKLRKHDLPTAILFDKDISRTLLGGEILPHEFAFGPSQRRSGSGISVDADSNVIRV